MRRASIFLPRYRWSIDALIGARCGDIPEVRKALKGVDASEDFMSALDNPDVCRNGVEGLTYTNFRLRRTLIVIGAGANPSELLDTAQHENMHAAMHITEAFGLNPYSEEPCYISGSVMRYEAEAILESIKYAI